MAGRWMRREWQVTRRRREGRNEAFGGAGNDVEIN